LGGHSRAPTKQGTRSQRLHHTLPPGLLAYHLLWYHEGFCCTLTHGHEKPPCNQPCLSYPDPQIAIDMRYQELQANLSDPRCNTLCYDFPNYLH
jgi:hypothetical protein